MQLRHPCPVQLFTVYLGSTLRFPLGPTKPVVYCIVSSIYAFGLYDRILTELEHYVNASPDAAWDFLKNAFETRLPAQVGKPTSIESPLPETFKSLEVRTRRRKRRTTRRWRTTTTTTTEKKIRNY